MEASGINRKLMEVLKGGCSDKGGGSESSKALYKCNVCGEYHYWNENMRYVERVVGVSYKASEEKFYTCSAECRKIAKPFFVNWLGSKDGWTKKSAEENFDKYVLPTMKIK